MASPGPTELGEYSGDRCCSLHRDQSPTVRALSPLFLMPDHQGPLTATLTATPANSGDQLTPPLNYKMNVSELRRTQADDGPANFKTAGRHPWRCRRTDGSRRAPPV